MAKGGEKAGAPLPRRLGCEMNAWRHGGWRTAGGWWGTHQHKPFLVEGCAKTNHDYIPTFLKRETQVFNVISAFSVVILL